MRNAFSAGLALSPSPLSVVPPAADRMVYWLRMGTEAMLTTTVPARTAVPIALTRSEVAPATSTVKVPVPVCTMLPVSAVVCTVPTRPGDRSPALVSVLPAPRLAVAPELNVAPARLMKMLVPVPRSTLPVIVP